MEGQLGKEGVGYMEQINRMTDQMATPWHNAPLYGEQGPALEAGGFTFPPPHPRHRLQHRHRRRRRRGVRPPGRGRGRALQRQP
ncbi:hypothetical protein G6F65_023016 [Rhizopus arrhizus]|nr:hypothetical protein G6F65_023016 [Rhizopus arrhizus]